MDFDRRIDGGGKFFATFALATTLSRVSVVFFSEFIGTIRCSLSSEKKVEQTSIYPLSWKEDQCGQCWANSSGLAWHQVQVSRRFAWHFKINLGIIIMYGTMYHGLWLLVKDSFGTCWAWCQINFLNYAMLDIKQNQMSRSNVMSQNGDGRDCILFLPTWMASENDNQYYAIIICNIQVLRCLFVSISCITEWCTKNVMYEFGCICYFKEFLVLAFYEPCTY